MVKHPEVSKYYETGCRLKMSTTFARKIFMLLRMKWQMKLKAELDAIRMNLARNLITFFLNLEKYQASHDVIRKVILYYKTLRK